ncbi:tetratricopeptide repeat protein [Candidatus Jidaibacter acanthamoebae]|uniref:tetratricopeptide repeat protein n=1 Tax=Candidatus Jidaibacter acanthamoebae TaxID=86105 RepID=UPI00057C3556|nr:tetratricopeptide repeat protein [Candidatus Jidaibacter acanthamoeba]
MSNIRNQARRKLSLQQVYLSQLKKQQKNDLETKEEIEQILGSKRLLTQQIYQDINTQIKILLINLIEESKQNLGKPPCKYAIMGLGSLARDEATPYSDIEFAILIEDITPILNIKNKEYFRILTKLLHLKVLNFGETTPDIHNIPFLKGIKCSIPMGFSFDGRANKGCKTPLGNYHISYLENNEKYELIATPKEMVRFQEDYWFNIDPHLPTILTTTVLIDGDDFLFNEYMINLKYILDRQVKEPTYFAQVKLREKRAIEVLLQDISRFEPNLAKEIKNVGRVYNIKYELYRLPIVVLSGLTLYFNLTANNSWDRIKEAVDRKHITIESASKLLEILDLITTIRLAAYLKYGQQNEELIVQNFSYLPNDNRFYISSKELYKIYAVLFPLNIVIRTMCRIWIEEKKISSFTLNIIPNNNLTKGQICYKLLSYTQATKFFKLVLNEKLLSTEEILNLPNNIVCTAIYSKLTQVYYMREKYNKAEKYCNFILGVNKGRIEYSALIETALALNRLGMIYYSKYEYNNAVEKFNEALKIYEAIYNKQNYGDTIAVLNNLGIVLGNLGEYNKALNYLNQALKECTSLCGNNHSKTAFILNNIGEVYIELKDYKISFLYLQRALEIGKMIHGDNHQFIAPIFNNLAIVYNSLFDYKAGIQNLINAFEIQKRSLFPSHTYKIILNNLDVISQEYSLQNTLLNNDSILECQSLLQAYNTLREVFNPVVSTTILSKSEELKSIGIMLCEFEGNMKQCSVVFPKYKHLKNQHDLPVEQQYYITKVINNKSFQNEIPIHKY